MADEISRAWRLTVAGMIIPLIVVVDQVSKWLVLRDARFNARGCLDGTERCGGYDVSSLVDLSMVWNRGMSFGVLPADGVMRWILFAVTLGIAGGFLFWLLRADRRLTVASLAIVVAGAVGNLIDRARFGAVVDFIDFSGPWFGWTLPAEGGPLAWIDGFYRDDGVLGIGFPWVFNVADAAITIGAILLFFDQFFMSKPAETSGRELSSGLDKP